MAEDHGAPEVGNYPGPGTEVVERQKIAKEQATQRFRSWTVQNEMRGVRKRRRKDEFSILPILERYKLNRTLCSLQRRREKTQRA